MARMERAKNVCKTMRRNCSGNLAVPVQFGSAFTGEVSLAGR